MLFKTYSNAVRSERGDGEWRGEGESEVVEKGYERGRRGVKEKYR